MQVGNGVALALQISGCKGRTVGGLRKDAYGMVDKVGVKAAFFDLLDGKIAGKLVHDGADHLQMCQLFGADIVQQAGDAAVGHGKFLRKIAQAGA